MTDCQFCGHSYDLHGFYLGCSLSPPLSCSVDNCECKEDVYDYAKRMALDEEASK